MKSTTSSMVRIHTVVVEYGLKASIREEILTTNALVNSNDLSLGNLYTLLS